MFAVHAKGDCKGWTPGPYTAGEQCRRCWKTENAATCRQLHRRLVASASTPVPAPALRVPLPCAHRGKLLRACSRGDTYECRFDGHEWARCTPGVNIVDAAARSCVNCPHRSADSAATIAITHWQRPAALARLLASIREHLPGYPVEIEDTRGNLSAGRNRLYGRIKTPLIVVMEEDFVVAAETAGMLATAVSILDCDPAIMGVGGVCIETPQRKQWGHNFQMIDGRMDIVASPRPLRHTPAGVSYRPCDLVLNWGVFRAELRRRVPWDESFPITEHKEYFYRASRAGCEFAFWSGLRIRHLRDRPNATYNTARGRNFAHLVKQKHGFDFAGRHV